MSIRILPLPKVTGIWKYEWSKYPDAVRVPMSDGKVIRYVLDVEQPTPVLAEKLRRFRNICTGYKNEKPEDAGTSDRPVRKRYRNHSITEEEK